MKSESSFLHYLTESGGFRYIFKNKGHKSYRGEHIKTQYDFLYDKVGNKLVDFIGRTEYFEKDLKFVLSKMSFGGVTIPREKNQVVFIIQNIMMKRQRQLLMKSIKLT